MTHHETKTYIHALQDIVRTYNERPHRSIGHLSPNEAELEVNKNHVTSALRKHYDSCREPASKRQKFQVGDIVRMKTGYGLAFPRGYEEQFSQELYRVEEVYKRLAVTMYGLSELESGRLLPGRAYGEELQLASDEELKIAKFVGERRRPGRGKEYRVIYRGFKKPVWISESQISADFRSGTRQAPIPPRRPGRPPRNQQQQQQQIIQPVQAIQPMAMPQSHRQQRQQQSIGPAVAQRQRRR